MHSKVPEIACGAINITFCVNDAFARYITVTIKSIAENNRGSRIHIHILTDGISEKNRCRISEVSNGYDNMSLNIYIVDDSPLYGLCTGRWTKYAWYRLLIPATLPSNIGRVLYLDADTLVVDDLSKLFNIDITGSSIAGIRDEVSFNGNTYHRLGYEAEKLYVNSGVLLMNLDYWRGHCTADTIISWALDNRGRLLFPDQDAINFVCMDSKLLLPFRYNVMQNHLENECYYAAYSEQIMDSVCNPAIIHYGDRKPWSKTVRPHTMLSEWLKYNAMLDHPVRRRHDVGFAKAAKISVWNYRHPTISVDEIKRKLSIF